MPAEIAAAQCKSDNQTGNGHGWDSNYIYILLIPVVLMAFNDEWLFPFGNPSDNWNNNAYFFENYFDSPRLATMYKASRLSWILKANLAHSIFDHLTAYYVLHVSMLLMIMSVFYIIAKNLFDRTPALLVTLAFGTYSQFHSIVSFEWDYQSHDGILNLLLTLLCILMAVRRERWRLWMILAGVAWACSVQSTYVGTYTPILPFWFLILNGRGGRPFFASVGMATLGGVAVTALFGLVSMAKGGPFLFFIPTIETALSFGFTGGYLFHVGYWQPFSHVLQSTLGLPLPMAVSILSAVVMLLCLIGTNPRRREFCAALGSLLIAAALHVYSQSKGHGHLSNDHFMAAGSPFVFLATCAIMHYCLMGTGITPPANRLRTEAIKVLALALFCGFLIFGDVITASFSTWVQTVSQLGGIWSDYSGWYSVQGLALMTILLVPAVILKQGRLRRSRAAAIGFLIFLAMMSPLTASIPVSSYTVSNQCPYRKDQYQAILDAYFYIRRFDSDGDLRLWYRNNETLDHPRCSSSSDHSVKINLTALYGGIWGMRFNSVIAAANRLEPNADYSGLVDEYLFTADFALFSGRRLQRLPRTFRAAIMSAVPGDHRQAVATLEGNAYNVDILDRTSIRHGSVRFDITMIEARRNDRRRAELRGFRQ